MEKRSIRIGVDVGGTNTDICAIDENTGALMVYKLPSSLHDQSAAVVEGVKVKSVYDGGKKIGALALLSCQITMTYNSELPVDADKQILAKCKCVKVWHFSASGRSIPASFIPCVILALIPFLSELIQTQRK